MKATRVVPCLLIVVVAIGVFTGCKKGPTESGGRCGNPAASEPRAGSRWAGPGGIIA